MKNSFALSSDLVFFFLRSPVGVLAFPFNKFLIVDDGLVVILRNLEITQKPEISRCFKCLIVIYIVQYFSSPPFLYIIAKLLITKFMNPTTYSMTLFGSVSHAALGSSLSVYAGELMCVSSFCRLCIAGDFSSSYSSSSINYRPI